MRAASSCRRRFGRSSGSFGSPNSSASGRRSVELSAGTSTTRLWPARWELGLRLSRIEMPNADTDFVVAACLTTRSARPRERLGLATTVRPTSSRRRINLQCPSSSPFRRAYRPSFAAVRRSAAGRKTWSCAGTFRSTGCPRSASLSQPSDRRLGHEWATEILPLRTTKCQEPRDIAGARGARRWRSKFDFRAQCSLAVGPGGALMARSPLAKQGRQAHSVVHPTFGPETR